MAVKIFKNAFRNPVYETGDLNQNLGKQNLIFYGRPRKGEISDKDQDTLSVKYTFKKADDPKPAAEPKPFISKVYASSPAAFPRSLKDEESLTIFFADHLTFEYFKNRKDIGKNFFTRDLEVFRKLPLNFLEKVYFRDDSVREIFWQIKHLLGKEYVASHEIESRLQELVSALMDLHRSTQETMSKIPVNKESTRIELYRRLFEAKRYIDENFRKKINLKDVAEIACLSECHFLRYFKATFEITPHQYLTKCRLVHAKSLLKGTQMSVAEISSEIGLENLSSFSRLFKKHFGLSPEKFRRAKVD